jgi:hypothetical protein
MAGKKGMHRKVRPLPAPDPSVRRQYGVMYGGRWLRRISPLATTSCFNKAQLYDTEAHAQEAMGLLLDALLTFGADGEVSIIRVETKMIDRAPVGPTPKRRAPSMAPERER